MNDAFIERKNNLSLELDEYLFKHPDLFKQIPNKAWIVITVSNDRDFNARSMALIKDPRRKKIVEAHKQANDWTIRPLQNV